MASHFRPRNSGYRETAEHSAAHLPSGSSIEYLDPGTLPSFGTSALTNQPVFLPYLQRTFKVPDTTFRDTTPPPTLSLAAHSLSVVASPRLSHCTWPFSALRILLQHERDLNLSIGFHHWVTGRFISALQFAKKSLTNRPTLASSSTPYQARYASRTATTTATSKYSTSIPVRQSPKSP